jgi:aspartate beta-hydroxylase
MVTPAQQLVALSEAGVAALQRGDGDAALKAFGAALQLSAVPAQAHLGLAYAHALLKQHPQALLSADEALKVEPTNLRALMLKADVFHLLGDGPSALSFYQAAMKAAPATSELGAELRNELARAEAASAHYESKLQATVQHRLSKIGADAQGVSARFSHSVEILLGKKQVFVPQPKHYYFPELPAIQFHDRARFSPWLDDVEAATEAIREELLAVLKDRGAFEPYVKRDPKRAALVRGGMLDNPDWGAFYLRKNGVWIEENAKRCPRTTAALARVPFADVPGRSPSILFSLLRPGARIPPHTGVANTRLICHLPLIVPPSCGFRVGNETRPWVEGRAWVFDDTIEHEAWNLSDQVRVILLFDIWQPELSTAERACVRDMFEALQELPGGQAEWDL